MIVDQQPATRHTPSGSRSTLGRRRGDRSLLRTPAVLLALPFLVVAVLFASSNLTSVGSAGYPLAHAAAANGTLIMIGPLVSLSAAWEMQTLRLVWGRWSVTRSWWRVLVGRVSVVATVGFAVMLAVYLYALLRSPIGYPGWAYPALSVVAILAWTGFGAAAGLLAGRLIALPVAVLVPYLVMSLPAGWEPVWIRHLNGDLFDCCSTSTVLDPRAVTASLAVLGAVFFVSICMAYLHLAPAQNPAHRTALALAVAVLAVVAATGFASDARELGALPTRERPADALQCTAGVCLWPEDAAAFPANAGARDTVLTAWEHLALPRPSQAFGPIATVGVLPVTTTSTLPQQAVVSMAQALPRAVRGCNDDYTDEQRNARFDDLSYLLLTTAGGDPAAAGLTVTTPPASAEAPNIWAATTPC